ncbi:MAG: hypothetical protein Q9195_007760 [Heterodermia aff. obscurata]
MVAEKLVKTTLETTFPEGNERQQFLKWYIGLDASLSKNSEISTLRPPMEVAQYRKILESVNWSSFDDIEKCYAALHGSGQKILAEPIYLGQDNQVLYYLSPRRVFTDTSQDLKEDADVHPYYLEMRPVTGRVTPLRFVFCLGVLEYVYDKFVEPKASNMTTTPFHVYLDVQSSSNDIWIVFSTIFRDEFGNDVDLDSQTNVWEVLPSPQNGRAIFRAMKITNLQKLFTPDQKQPFFNQRIGGEGFEVLLRPWVVDKGVVTKIMEESSGRTNVLEPTLTPTGGS